SFCLPAGWPRRKTQATPPRGLSVRTVRVPGDKSITHRALILAGVAAGRSRIEGALGSLDTEATAAALRALGVEVSPLGEQLGQVGGSGGFAPPVAPLDCATTGTAPRLLCGALAAHRFSSRLTGDASLCRRPMRRVTEPLAAMGAAFTSTTGNLPLTI